MCTEVLKHLKSRWNEESTVVFELVREISSDVIVCLLEELVIVKVSYESHHFPSETDPQVVGYSPTSSLHLCTAFLRDSFDSVLHVMQVG